MSAAPAAPVGSPRGQPGREGEHAECRERNGLLRGSGRAAVQPGADPQRIAHRHQQHRDERRDRRAAGLADHGQQQADRHQVGHRMEQGHSERPWPAAGSDVVGTEQGDPADDEEHRRENVTVREPRDHRPAGHPVTQGPPAVTALATAGGRQHHRRRHHRDEREQRREVGERQAGGAAERCAEGLLRDDAEAPECGCPAEPQVTQPGPPGPAPGRQPQGQRRHARCRDPGRREGVPGRTHRSSPDTCEPPLLCAHRNGAGPGQPDSCLATSADAWRPKSCRPSGARTGIADGPEASRSWRWISLYVPNVTLRLS